MAHKRDSRVIDWLAVYGSQEEIREEDIKFKKENLLLFDTGDCCK